MFTAVSYSVLLHGFVMWKELITSVETDPRHVKVTSLFSLVQLTSQYHYMLVVTL